MKSSEARNLFRDPGCRCQSPAEALRAEIGGAVVLPCPMHGDRVEFADRVQTIVDEAVADARGQRARRRPPDEGDPLLDALERKVGASGLPLNASADQWARSLGLPGARASTDLDGGGPPDAA